MKISVLKMTKILVGILGLLMVVVMAGLGFLEYARHVNARKLAIHTPNGIQEGMYVTIGGIEQWIQIRGLDRDNPVLLYV